MSRFCSRFHWLFLALVATIWGASPQQPLSLYVTVEKDGGIVQGLTEENFRLYEDGQARSFRLEEPQKPASIVLLVEYSQGSWYYVRDIVSAMEGFLNVAPESHWYALATFAHHVEINVDFTKRRGKIRNGFANLDQPLWDEIDTYDAIYSILEKLERLKGRRILVVIGSGFDTFSSHTVEDIERKLESVNVVVYAVGAGSALRGRYEPYLGTSARMEVLQAEAFLKGITSKTGGQAWFPRFEAAFPDVLKGIMQMVGNRYRLVYTPQVTSDGKFHELKVEAFVVKDDRREDFDVRVRNGWRFFKGSDETSGSDRRVTER